MYPITLVCTLGWLVLMTDAAALQEHSEKGNFIGVLGEGKHLAIKAIPAIEDYQSDIYEVYQDTYNYVSLKVTDSHKKILDKLFRTLISTLLLLC